MLMQEQEEHQEQLTQLLASIRREISSRPAQTDGAPVVQGTEFLTPQNSVCHHTSSPGANNPATPVPIHSGL